MSDNRKMTAAQVATQLEGWADEYRITQKDAKQPKWMRERADALAEAYEHSAKMIRENLVVLGGERGNPCDSERNFTLDDLKWLFTRPSVIGVLLSLLIAGVVAILLV